MSGTKPTCGTCGQALRDDDNVFRVNYKSGTVKSKLFHSDYRDCQDALHRESVRGTRREHAGHLRMSD